MSATDVTEKYFQCLRDKRDFTELFSDNVEFVSFTAPVRRSENRADFIAMTQQFYAGILSFTVTDTVVADDKVCVLSNYVLQTPTGSFHLDVAEVFYVKQDKIVKFALYFDTAAFPAMEVHGA